MCVASSLQIQISGRASPGGSTICCWSCTQGCSGVVVSSSFSYQLGAGRATSLMSTVVVRWKSSVTRHSSSPLSLALRSQLATLCWSIGLPQPTTRALRPLGGKAFGCIVSVRPVTAYWNDIECLFMRGGLNHDAGMKRVLYWPT